MSVVGDECICEEGISLMSACWVSQSMLNQILNAVQTVMTHACVWKKMFNGEIMFYSAFEKDTEKVVLSEVKGLIQIIVKVKAENVSRKFLSPNILLRGMKYWLQKQLRSFENERLISFSYTIWFMISEKNIVHVSSPWRVDAPEVSMRHTENVE